MVFNDLLKIEIPETFPSQEYAEFNKIAQTVLLSPKHDIWKEFAGASNLIGWRFRACYENMKSYNDSWMTFGVHASFEELYFRERCLFGMFVNGVSCIESTCYASYALASHPNTLGLSFGLKEQRHCSPPSLRSALKDYESARVMVDSLNFLLESEEWELWVSLRNRMTHRSNLPRIIHAAVGSAPQPSKVMEFAATSSTQAFDADEKGLEELFCWLAVALRKLLIGACFLVPESKYPH